MKKYLIAFIITTLFLTSCNSVNSEDDTAIEQNFEDTDENASSELDGIPSINVLTKDFNIDYINNNENFKDVLLINFIDGDFIKIDHSDIIRLEFFQSPSQSLVLQSFYIKNNEVIDSSTEDVVILDKSDNLDIPLLYDEDNLDIQAVIYNVEVEFENASSNYSFIVGIDRPLSQMQSNASEDINNNSDLSNKETDSSTSNSHIGYLSEDAQLLYDEYKTSLDKSLLKNLEPLEVAELFIQAHKERSYDIAYSFITTKGGEGVSFEQPSESEYIEKFTSMTEGNISDYLKVLEFVADGEFIEDGEHGYIKYEITPNSPMAFDLVNDNGTWLVEYFPNY